MKKDYESALREALEAKVHALFDEYSFGSDETLNRTVNDLIAAVAAVPHPDSERLALLVRLAELRKCDVTLAPTADGKYGLFFCFDEELGVGDTPKAAIDDALARQPKP